MGRKAEWHPSKHINVSQHYSLVSHLNPLKREVQPGPRSGVSASPMPEACGFGCSCSPSSAGSVAGIFLRRLPCLWSLATKTAGHSFAKL